jgi:hypothetical protein
MEYPYNGQYAPLSKILTADNFENGQCGWMDLVNNFVLPGHKPRPSIVEKTQWGPTMISNLNFGYAGTHGALNGNYALKLSTRPIANPYDQPPAPGSQGLAIKRMSARGKGLTQIELWYAYTPEQDRIGMGETDIRAFGFMFDIQDAEARYFIGLRYLNSMNGEYVGRWQYSKANEVSDREWAYGTDGDWCKRGVDPQWFGKRHEDGSTDGWQWVPNGQQKLVYNESDDKINWQYLRFTIDTKTREYVDFQSLEQTFDLRGIEATKVAPYKGIKGLLNPLMWIEADTDRRVFLYADSVTISVEY